MPLQFTYRFIKSHPLPFMVRKPGIFLVLLTWWLIMATKALGQPCTSFTADLTSSPTATFSNTGFFSPSGLCCGATSGSRCFSYVVTLHPSANAVVINLSRQGGTWGQIDYFVDCMNYGIVEENRPLVICLSGPGPHTITFCRTGPTTPTFSATLQAQSFTPNVTLGPFANTCTDGPIIYLAGGSPFGGKYFLNGVESFFVIPSMAGPGTHTITYVYSGPSASCASTATQTLTINQAPVVTVPDQSFCAASGLVAMSGGSPSGGEYRGTFISNGMFDTNLSGSGSFPFTYRYITPQGCQAEATGVVRVNPVPPADAGPSQVIASGSSATLSAQSPNTMLFNYNWSPPSLVINPNQPASPTIPLSQSQLFILTVTNPATHCQSFDKTAVYVSGGPLSIALIRASSNQICQQDSVFLFVLPSGGSGSYLYQWFDNNSPPGTPLKTDAGIWHKPSITTNYRVEVRDAANPAANPVVEHVTVNVTPLPVVTLQPFAPVCGNETHYELSGALPAGGYFSLPAQNRYGITSVNPKELGEGFHTISYTVVSGHCRSIQSQYLQVFPEPKAKFYARQDFCATHEVTFLNLSENTNHYTWQIGTEANFVNPPDPLTYQFAIPDVTRLVPVTLTATNTTHGCTSVLTRMVEVLPPTVAGFDTNQSLTGCAPYPVRFNNTTTGPVAFFLWDFGDGSFSTERDPQHVFQNHTDQNITYTVELLAMSGNFMCVSRHSMQITVRPFLKSGFGLAPVTSCSPYQTEIFSNALGLNITQHWDFGDGTSYYSAAPLLAHTWQNNTPDPQTFIVTQTVTNPQGCADTMQAEVTVFPFVQSGFSASTTQGCAPLTVNFSDTSTGAAYNFFWDFGNGGTSALRNPSVTFENKTNATIVYQVIQVVSNNNHCSDTTWLNITVHPEVTARFDLTPSRFCAPHQAQIISTSTGNVSSLNWYLVHGPASTHLGSNAILNHIFQNPGPDPLNIMLVLEVGNQQGCQNRMEMPLTVFPEVTAHFTPNQTNGCQPLEIIFTNQSVNGHTFLWDFGDGGSSALHSPAHTYQNINHTSTQTYNVSLVVESAFNCTDSFQLPIELFPNVEALFAVEQASGCSPFTVNIEHLSKGASMFSWDFGDGATSADGSAQLTHTYINNTNQPVSHLLRLTASSPHGCFQTLEQVITVYPSVTADFSSVTAGCHPLTANFSNASVNAHNYLWDIDNEVVSLIANPIFTFTNVSHTTNRDYLVRLYAESVYGCSDMAQTIIRVHPSPDPSFQLSSLAGCTPFDIEITNHSEGATSHLWSFGDGTTSTSGGSFINHTYYLAPGNDMQTRNISLEVANGYGCQSSLTRQVVIYPQIVAGFSASVTEGCHPLRVEFTNQSQGASAHAAYLWTYGDGFGNTTTNAIHSHTFLNHSYTTPATFQVQLLALNANACADTRQMQITVHPAPLSHFSISEPVGCSPHHFSLTNLSQGANGFEWSFGDGSPLLNTTSAVVNHSYINQAGNAPAQYTLSLLATNNFGCSRLYQQQVMVYPEVDVRFSSDSEGCHPLWVSFANHTIGSTYQLWNFGEGNQSLQTNPTHLFMNHSYTASETFAVSLYAENDWGCHGSASGTITVRPRPMSNFDIITRSGCSPFSSQVINLAEGALNYHWDMGNHNFGGYSDTFSNTWTNNTGALLNYTLRLRVENEFGCTDQSEQSITVFPEVNAGFGTSDGIVAGCSPFDVQFVNHSQLTQSYIWNMGDGNLTAGANPWHRFTNQGPANAVYSVQLTATSLFGCKDSTQLQITVFPLPEARFDATPRLQTYPSRTITLNNRSKPGNWNYHWSFGDGNSTTTTSLSPISHTYSPWNPANMATRQFTIRLNVENQGCSDSTTQTITITSPVPQAVFSPSAQGCAPFLVQFYNQSLHAHSYLWTFGDGSFSIEETPRHLFVNPGVYQVQLIAYGDGGSDTTYRQITVHPNPVASFALVSPIIEIPYQPLQLINRSTGADFYHWNFGDGNTSTEFEPTHWYQYANTYTITLAVATNTQPSCRDTFQLKNALLAQEACRVVFPNAFTPQASGPHGGACNPFDLQNTTFEVFYPKMEGIERYELEIFTRWGELIFRSTDPNKGWDGYYRGKLSGMDVYVWKFSGRCINGKNVNLVGDVTLIR